MRSLQQRLLAVLPVHNEENPSFTAPRHPLVVYFHLGYIELLLLVFIFWTEQTDGQWVYFSINIGLYISSAAYHTWRPNWYLRFVDQTMISWYVLVVPLPMLYNQPWAIEFFGIAAALTAVSKWYKWESTDKVEARIFLLIGAVSTTLVFGFGLPAIGVDRLSVTGAWILIATALFIAKLVIYYFEFSLIERVIGSQDLGHAVLWMPNGIITIIVVLYPQ